MKVPYLPGVYCLKAVNSKLIYIGSSHSLGIRRNLHMQCMRNNDRDRGCSAMIDAKIAGDLVVFEVIEVCSEYLDREQYWIDFYKHQDTYSLVNTFNANRQG